MNNDRAAQREAYALVPETCPKVDAALDAAAEAIKDQTGRLRDALIDALRRAMDAEDKLEDAERRIAELEHQIHQLERYVA